MIQPKKKFCEYHQHECYIYKNHEGKKYCKDGYMALFGKKTIKPFSKKREELNKIYKQKRDEFMKAHPICEGYGLIECCTKEATDCHHAQGRVGKNFIDETTFVALCRSCHQFIETAPDIAKELKLSKNRL